MTDEISPRGQVLRYVRQYIADEEQFEMPVLVDDTLEHFSKDKAFVKALIEQSLRELVYQIAQEEIRHTRDRVIVGDSVMTRDGIKEKAAKKSVFASWLEHVKDRHIRLMDMTREDLLIAATERQTRGEHELELASLWRRIADGLEGGQTVSSRFSAEEIEAMREGKIAVTA